MQNLKSNLLAFGQRLLRWWKVIAATLAGSVFLYVGDQYFGNFLIGAILPAFWHWLEGWARAPGGGGITAIVVTVAIAWAAFDPKGLWQRGSKKLRRDLEVSETEVRRLRTENATLAKEHREYEWQIQWGSRPPGIQELAPADIERAATEIARLDSVLSRLYVALEHMWTAAGKTWSETGGVTPEFWCGRYVFETIYQPTLRSLSLLKNPHKLQKDHREVFKLFFTNYKGMREWFQRMAEFQNRSLHSFGAYANWHAADLAFFAKLDEFPNLPFMDETRGVVKVALDNGYPAQLPVPVDDAGAYLIFAKVLAETTPDEERFLGFFFGDLPELVPDDPTTWLPNSVLHAAEKLATRGILIQTPGKSTLRFCLSPIAHRALVDSRRTETLVREWVDLPLNAVCGTGSSGSGARPTQPPSPSVPNT